MTGRALDRRPLVCLVTDSARLAPDGGFAAQSAGVLEQAARAVEAGVDLIQVRERRWEAAALGDVVAAIVGLARGSQTRVVVNDRLDVALTAGAHGVHLPAAGIPAAEARALAPAGFLIGRSVHGAAEAQLAAAAADYLIAGPVYPTVSKPAGSRWLGEAGLRSLVQAAGVPVVAIGGVTVDRVANLCETGAAGIAAIGLFQRGPLTAVVDAIRARFDSLKPAS
jgi:thiamine-phosphate pyrophosphorylase